jgi:hypothetical protein
MTDTLQNFAPPLGTWEVETGSPPEPEAEKPVAEPKPVEPARELMIYFLDRFKEVHGFPYKPMWVKDVNLMRKFLERYRAEARPMLEWFFDELRGQWNGQVQTPSVFAAGSAWVLDQIYVSWKSNTLALPAPTPNNNPRSNSVAALIALAE